MNDRTSYEVIMSCMPSAIARAMSAVALSIRQSLTEFRVYIGRPPAYIFPGTIRFLGVDGRLFSVPDDKKVVTMSATDVAHVVGAISRHSLHSCSRELSQGFFTLENGVRAGICGTYSESSGQLRDISSVNFRLAREVQGCADDILPKLFSARAGLLICGGVGSGKTTLLRELCRLCGNSCKVTLIDERNELSASRSGRALTDVGMLTDVLVGGVRSAAITSAVRSLSPDYIFCDEISTAADADAIISAVGSGVRFAATMHADSYSGLLRRPVAAQLLSAGAFDYAVFLSGPASPGKIAEFRSLKNAA